MHRGAGTHCCIATSLNSSSSMERARVRREGDKNLFTYGSVVRGREGQCARNGLTGYDEVHGDGVHEQKRM